MIANLIDTPLDPILPDTTMSAASITNDDEQPPRCCGFRKCKVKSTSVVLVECAGKSKNCKNYVHNVCFYEGIFKPQVEKSEQPMDDPPLGIAACSVNCWKAIQKKLECEKQQPEPEGKSRRQRTTWEDDGSIKVLLDWITTEGNYDKYVGGNGNTGETKASFEKTIAQMIREKCPGSQKNAQDVNKKIALLDKQFREVTDWLNGTGSGVDLTNADETIRSKVTKKCPYYFELEPIFGDRPNAQPLASNEDEDLDNVEFMGTSSDGRIENETNDDIMSDDESCGTSSNTSSTATTSGTKSNAASVVNLPDNEDQVTDGETLNGSGGRQQGKRNGTTSTAASTTNDATTTRTVTADVNKTPKSSGSKGKITTNTSKADSIGSAKKRLHLESAKEPNPPKKAVKSSHRSRSDDFLGASTQALINLKEQELALKKREVELKEAGKQDANEELKRRILQAELDKKLEEAKAAREDRLAQKIEMRLKLREKGLSDDEIDKLFKDDSSN